MVQDWSGAGALQVIVAYVTIHMLGKEPLCDAVGQVDSVARTQGSQHITNV